MKEKTSGDMSTLVGGVGGTGESSLFLMEAADQSSVEMLRDGGMTRVKAFLETKVVTESDLLFLLPDSFLEGTRFRGSSLSLTS
jgi:hypothetical protein